MECAPALGLSRIASRESDRLFELSLASQGRAEILESQGRVGPESKGDPVLGDRLVWLALLVQGPAEVEMYQVVGRTDLARLTQQSHGRFQHSGSLL